MDLRIKSIVASEGPVFGLALIPLGKLVVGLGLHSEWLGANPAEFITRSTGEWALRFLLLTLAVTPLRKLCRWPEVARLRRMLGLFAFFYGMVHLTSYLTFDHAFDFSAILEDIVRRPFITVGFTALTLMLPLAVTSTNAMVRRLGAKQWRALHKLVYLIAPLGILHFWWMVKKDVTEPAVYGVVLAALLGHRLTLLLVGHGRSARRSSALPLTGTAATRTTG